MGYVVSASRGAWGRLHRDDVPCTHMRQSNTLRPATVEEVGSLTRCRWCFPKDPVKQMLLEEGVRYRAAQRLAEQSEADVLALLYPQLRGDD